MHKIKWKRTKSDMMRIQFQIVHIQNASPAVILEADSIVTFKKELDKYMVEEKIAKLQRKFQKVGLIGMMELIRYSGSEPAQTLEVDSTSSLL